MYVLVEHGCTCMHTLYVHWLVNILEVLPKDKKAKEEKTAVLGQASLDLLPVLLNESHNSALTINLHTATEGGGAPPGDANEAVSIYSINKSYKYRNWIKG